MLGAPFCPSRIGIDRSRPLVLRTRHVPSIRHDMPCLQIVPEPSRMLPTLGAEPTVYYKGQDEPSDDSHSGQKVSRPVEVRHPVILLHPALSVSHPNFLDPPICHP